MAKVHVKGTMETQTQPLITFVMPCYNSAEFMQAGIESLLAIEHPCEIILINDGSSDDTSLIAHAYADEFDHVIAIDQENANWGGVVNRGITMASGIYFKVIDSDDHFDQGALKRVLDTLQQLVDADEAPDLLISNYVYDHATTNTTHTIQYRKLFPQHRVFTWKDMGHHGVDQFIMIHASWFKTSVLRESGLELPTKMSYMDSLVVLHPMPYVKTLYYLDVDAYHYLIGREGQSVEVDVVKKHIDEQLTATRLAITDVNYAALYAREPNCALLMMGYVQCMMSVSTIYLFLIDTPESLEKNRQLWAYMKEKNRTLYDNVRFTWAGLANRRTTVGRTLACWTYLLAKRIFKFA